jgi:hypothetical protein
MSSVQTLSWAVSCIRPVQIHMSHSRTSRHHQAPKREQDVRDPP